MKKIIYTIGLPRSGKSTWAKKQNLPIVSPDGIRLALHGQPFIKEAEPMVRTISDLMVKALHNSGNDTIIFDSTGVGNAKIEEAVYNYTKKDDCEFHIFLTGEKECIKRAKKNKQLYLVDVIKKMSFYVQRLIMRFLKDDCKLNVTFYNAKGKKIKLSKYNSQSRENREKIISEMLS